MESTITSKPAMYGCKVDLVKAVRLSYGYAVSFLEGRYKIIVNCNCLQKLQCSV